MNELVRYDAMCYAIAECHSVDEVKDLRDKAMALELYAKQARNTDAERKACEIRLRAERRTGELLKDLARTEPAKRNDAGANQHKEASPNDAEKPLSPYAKALVNTGISSQSASRYQQLADVPADTFEMALREPVKPTTTAILDKAKAMAVVQEARAPQPKMPDDVLWLWGRMRDFEREGYFSKDPAALLPHLTETMRADVNRIAPAMAEFFNRLEECSHESA